ncbi:hypothetical protein ETB97_005307 [Aspergillus alliaceus]|uniref:AB hydrolase-1 domain-containing protein n=1 Tax=Petromyces alliaceus TaxID=209559 RepID=A0A8H6EA56_PETAA|nr:hypothetical protein ETB97_005307 [Aspergillus burnettii]
MLCGRVDLEQDEWQNEMHPGDLEEGYPFYRPEPAQTFRRLGEMKPSVLYVFGENSELSSPTARQAKMNATGTGVGRNSGVSRFTISSAKKYLSSASTDPSQGMVPRILFKDFWITSIAPGAWYPPTALDPLIAKLTSHGYICKTVPFPSVQQSVEVKGLIADVNAVRGLVEPAVNAGQDVIVISHSWSGLPVNSTLEGLGQAERQGQNKTKKAAGRN